MGKTISELRKPRVVSQRQSHRSNVPTTSAEVYYRISLYNEFVSHVIADLRERLTDMQSGSWHWVVATCAKPMLQP